MKSAITLSFGNVMTSKAQVRCKVTEATLLLPGFLAKKWVKILIVPAFRLKLDDVTVSLSLIVLSRFFYKLTLILSYFMPKFVKIECHLHG